MDTQFIQAWAKTKNKSIKERFISEELLTRYCKIIGQKYPDHICSKCQGEDNVIPDVQIEWSYVESRKRRT